MKKFKHDRIDFSLHQTMIKLVYDTILKKHPRFNPNVNNIIKEDEEDITLDRVLKSKVKKNQNKEKTLYTIERVNYNHTPNIVRTQISSR